jgi:proteasome assembly chaperone (PAC2) family protein
MQYDTFQLETMPDVRTPVFIIGFRGWGNALEVSSGMAAYIVDSLAGRSVGRMDPDRCYRYDETRPMVNIESGRMISINPPGGSFFSIKTQPDENDLVVLIADEPNLSWYHFSQELAGLARRLNAQAVISLGSMFDNVLHTDRIISAVATGSDYAHIFSRHGVVPINYQGPSAIHTIILETCRKQGLLGASFWGHCPAYLQGITHHGMMLHLARLLSDIASFTLATDTLKTRWEALDKQIRELIADNPKLREIVDQIRRKKRAGALQNLEKKPRDKGKVIDLRDFIDS